MLVRNLGDGLTIVRLHTPADTARWRSAFVDAYPRIFADPPYNEQITPSEAGDAWDYLTSAPDHITLVARDGDLLVGFGIAIPLGATRKVAASLAGLVPQKHTYYLAELGVIPEYRDRGIGHALVMERLRQMDTALFSHVVLRVSKENPNTLYVDLGFEDMGVSMDVVQRRTDGQIHADRRVFLSKVLSQVDLD